jgi:hypothetical protein
MRKQSSDQPFIASCVRKNVPKSSKTSPDMRVFERLIDTSCSRAIETVLVVARPATRCFCRPDRRQGPREARRNGRRSRARSGHRGDGDPSREPLFDAAWLKPGTHVVSMGFDPPGKRELPSDLLSEASLFCDLLSQSVQSSSTSTTRSTPACLP